MIFRALHKPQLPNISSILFFCLYSYFPTASSSLPSPMTQTTSMTQQHRYLNFLSCILPQRTCIHGSLQMERLSQFLSWLNFFLITQFKHYLLCNTFPHLTELKPPHLLLCQSIPHSAMAPHSSTLAWKIPWMEEPGRLQSMGSLRVRHD